jgi:hypothetical protein
VLKESWFVAKPFVLRDARDRMGYPMLPSALLQEAALAFREHVAH